MKTEQEAFIQEEREQEAINERKDSEFFDFKSDNYKDLMRDFCEDKDDEFNIYCREAFERWLSDR